jgi:hypothetical protein
MAMLFKVIGSAPKAVVGECAKGNIDATYGKQVCLPFKGHIAKCGRHSMVTAKAWDGLRGVLWHVGAPRIRVFDGDTLAHRRIRRAGQIQDRFGL